MKAQRKLILNYIKSNEIEKALEAALDTIENDDLDYKVCFYAGYCYFLQNNYKEAIKYYKKAQSLATTENEHLESSKGLSKIYITYDYLYLDSDSKNEVEKVLLSTLKNRANTAYTELEKASITFLLNLYLYNDIDKYMDLFFTFCTDTSINSNGKIVLNDNYKEEGFSLLKEYFIVRLRNFERALKDIVDSGSFSKPRTDLIAELVPILDRYTGLKDYYKVLLDIYSNKFLSEIADAYLLYLTFRTYTTYSSLHELLLFIEELFEKDIKLVDESVILMVLSDFMNSPTVLGTSATYKKILYNTLSPTILLIRFAKREETGNDLLNIYGEIEVALNISYSMKKEYISTLMLKDSAEQEILTNRDYSILDGIDKLSISHRINMAVLVESAMKSMNIKVLVDLFSIYREENITDHIVEWCLDLENMPSSIKTVLGLYRNQNEKLKKDESLEETSEQVKKIAKHVYRTNNYKNTIRDHLLNNINSQYYLNGVRMHMKILNKEIEEVYKYLTETEKSLDEYRLYLNEINALVERFDLVYSYHKFLCEYTNKAIKSSSEKKVEQGSLNKYISIYSKEYLVRENLLPLDLLTRYKYPVDKNIFCFRHLIAINNYEKENKSISLVLLKELYEERPQDYYVANDLGVCLVEMNQSITPIDKYLRDVQNINNSHLLEISMHYHRRQSNWEIVERRAKEILVFGYDYVVKMALVEALSEQKKYKYAVKIIRELEEESKEINYRTNTVRVFMIYLYIKIDKFEEAQKMIDLLLQEKELGTEERNRAIQYKKYICATLLQRAVATEETEEVLKIADTYKKLDVNLVPENSVGEVDRITAISDQYAELVSKILRKEAGTEIDFKLTAALETDDQLELITLSKLILLNASINNQLSNPVVHNTISCCIKKANLQGETREALEVELLLRVIRDENVENYYEENRKSEETPFARVLLSILYHPSELAANTRDYLKNTTALDMDMIELLAKEVAAQENPRNTADLESIFLHLCRTYTADNERIRWLYDLLKN